MRISTKNLGSTILSLGSIIPLFRPRILVLYGSFQTLFYGLQCLLVVALFDLVVVLFLKGRIKTAFSPITYLVVIYKMYEVLAAYRNGILDLSTIVNAGVIIASTAFADYFLRKSSKEYLGVLSIYTGILVFVNNLSFFTMGTSSFTDATGNYIYFWSTKNHLSSLFFITFIAAVLYNGICRKKTTWIWSLFSVGNVIWGTIMFNSSTTIVGVAILLSLYIFFQKNVLCWPVLWYLCGIGINIAIVGFRIQNKFSWLIEGILHKNLSLNGRTTIWDMALLYIAKSPIWGYGESSIFSFSFAATEIPAHNQFLDVAIVCGIPGMVLFSIVLYAVFQKLGIYKRSFVSRLIVCALLGYIVMSISESPNPYQPWFIMFAIAYRVPEIDRLYINISYQLTNESVLKKRRVRGTL